MLALAAVLVAAGPLRADEKRTREELTNFLLGAEYSQWLVGAISQIADKKEIDRYLELSTDEQAREFIDRFWAERAPKGDFAVWPGRGPRDVFRRRAQEADRLYTEGVTLGRRTDRGTIYVLYGEPAEVTYEIDEEPPYDSIEVWRYDKKAAKGLDGRRPKSHYRFVEEDGLTVTYRQRLSMRNRM